jgi:hypothetical protein
MPTQTPDEFSLDRDVLERARTAADEVAGTLRVAAALVASGRRVDLTGLDGDIGNLCRSLLDLPSEKRRAMRPLLIGLLADLDLLAITIATP